MSHAMHANSLASYAMLRPEERKAAILAVYRGSTLPLSDRAVMEALGFSDGNAVKPRITELVDNGRLYECGTIKCPVTGRPVRVCTNTTLI